MKTSDSMIGGSLRPEAYAPYAEYFARFLEAYDSAGVPVQYLTVQNEPQYEPGDYPGMKMPAADRAKFIGGYLGPLLRQRDLRPKILDWDHNWDMPQEPLGVLADPTARRFVDGVAWHCYGGDVSAQSTVHRTYPDEDVFLTECSGGTWQEGGVAGALKEMMGTLVIDGTRNWARGVAFWSLALDPGNGPHSGGCGTCRGVVTIDPPSGAVTRNVEYFVLGHASRFVPPGAVRVASDSDVGGLKSVAFRDPDGSIALLVLDTATEPRTFDVRFEGRSFRSTLPAGAVATYRW
jgi:glucosylceramidase